jgi:hypothetical protein
LTLSGKVSGARMATGKKGWLILGGVGLGAAACGLCCAFLSRDAEVQALLAQDSSALERYELRRASYAKTAAVLLGGGAFTVLLAGTLRLRPSKTGGPTG